MIRQDTDGLWAITSYFNPLGYRRRRENYRVFRNHLPVPLVTIELAYGPNFELCGEDAEILVQLRGRDILWQKERLLNQALQALPKTCRKVVWVDCDMIFTSGDWHRAVSERLDSYALVQPFAHLYRMPRDWKPEDAWPRDPHLLRSIPFLVSQAMSLRDCLALTASQNGCAPGAAWAMRRDILEKHHLYDACIIGGGPFALARSAYGYFEDAMRHKAMNAKQREHYLAWAEPFYDAVRAQVTYVEGNLIHLWHGHAENRRYDQRHYDFRPFEFDPFEDIAVDPEGAWRWNSHKTDMHAFVRDYFVSRKEDG